MAFGGAKIDNLGVTRPFPAASMLTGLFANALGWRRIERKRHQDLQYCMVFAARIDRMGTPTTDYQTALLYADDEGWTTLGKPEGRNKNSPSFRAARPGASRTLTDELYRDYYADMRVTVALRLESSDDTPTLDELAAALQEPKRPLFIGRKPCLPSGPLFGGFVEGDTVLAALLAWPLAGDADGIRMQWPQGEGVGDVRSDREYPHMITDQRNWQSGLHGGGRWVFEGRVDRGRFAAGKGVSNE